MFIKSLLWFPFDMEKNRYYLLVFNQVGRQRNWTGGELDFLNSASVEVGVALKKVRLLLDLAEREKQLLFEQNLFTSGPVVVFRWQARENWPVEYVSDNIIQFGYSKEDLLCGKLLFSKIIHPDDLERVGGEVVGYSNSGADNFEQEYRIVLADGSERHVFDYTQIIRNADGVITHYHGYIIDITESKMTEAALFEQQEQAYVTLQSIGDGVIAADMNGRVLFMNQVAEELLGISNTGVAGRVINEIYNIVNEKTGSPMENPVAAAIARGKRVEAGDNTVLVCNDGRKIPVENSASPIRSREGNIVGAVMVFHDVIEARKLARQLEYQATHDSLTDLFNRREFERQLDELVANCRYEDSYRHCVLYLDLDQFKLVNDTCGHTAGDRLLKDLPPLIQKVTGDGNLLARLGGDEFGIILKNCSLEDAGKIAGRIIKVISSYRFIHGDHVFEIGASVGVVDVCEQQPGTVLGNADMACYMAKDSGRNRYHVFTENDRDIAKRQIEMEWVSRLNRGLTENRFELYYQKIDSLQKNGHDKKHYEILLRLKDENNRIVSPSEFISAAERYNLMGEIDKWVINATLKNYADNKLEYLDGNIMFSVNLSGVSLSDDNLPGYISERMNHYGVPGRQICFEVTETAAIANLNKISGMMNSLQELGISFSLDDFGSGLSSYTYLKHLPVDYIKIDGNFVSDIINDDMDLAIVESINYLGHAMNLKTVAEYVVSDDVRSKLQEMGIDYAQGYAIHRPQSLADLKI